MRQIQSQNQTPARGKGRSRGGKKGRGKGERWRTSSDKSVEPTQRQTMSSGIRIEEITEKP